MTERSFYEALGVGRDASQDEIKKAFKRKAVELHPDRNPGDAAAEAQFKEANEAYQTLSDPQKRAAYDRFGHGGQQGHGGDPFSHMRDIFEEMFNAGAGPSARRGADIRTRQKLSLKEAAFGCKRDVHVDAIARCGACSGAGGKDPVRCPQCGGSGHVSSARGFAVFTATCQRCAGSGTTVKEPCQECRGRGAVKRGRKCSVTFPPGVGAGVRVRCQGQGDDGPPGSPPGDLYVDVDVEEDPLFERDGADLATRLKVSFAQAALGCEAEVPLLEGGAANVRLEPGTQPGACVALPGLGVPRIDGRGRGSLIVVVQVEVPKGLTAKAEELLRELEAEIRRGG